MKFDVLERVSSKEAIEDGAWMRVNAPGTSNPLYRDFKAEDPKEPVRIRVRSIRSEAYQAHAANEERKAFNAAKDLTGQKQRDAIVAVTKKRRVLDFAVLVTEVENVSKGVDGPVKPSHDDLIRIGSASESGWLVDQVFVFARDDENFGPLESPNGSSGD